MDKIKGFFAGSIDEMRNHVTWPTRSELQNQTILVLVASLIFAIVIGGADFGFKALMQAIYDLPNA